jgi:hypothetical protein
MFGEGAAQTTVSPRRRRRGSGGELALLGAGAEVPREFSSRLASATDLVVSQSGW